MGVHHISNEETENQDIARSKDFGRKVFCHNCGHLKQGDPRCSIFQRVRCEARIKIKTIKRATLSLGQKEFLQI